MQITAHSTNIFKTRGLLTCFAYWLSAFSISFRSALNCKHINNTTAGWFKEDLIEKANLKRLKKKKTRNQYTNLVNKSAIEINHLKSDYFSYISYWKENAFEAEVIYVTFFINQEII